MSLKQQILEHLTPGLHYDIGMIATGLRRPLDSYLHNAVGYLVRKGLLIRETVWGQRAIRLASHPACHTEGVDAPKLYSLPTGTNLKDFPSISEAEMMLGLKTSALYRWLRNHGLLIACPKRGKYRRVPPDVLERYLEGTERQGVKRVDTRPHGWVGIYKACALVDDCNSSVIWRAVKRGEVKAARVGFINYYCPEDLEALRFSLKDYPLPGWIQVKTCAGQHGADRQTVIEWLRRKDYEVRKYRRPEDRQMACYALEPALRAWESYYLAYKPDGRKLTMQQARAIRRRRNAGEKRITLAREYGVSDAAIRQIANGVTYREAEMEKAA